MINKVCLLVILMIFAAFSVNAQYIDDDLESWLPGEPVFGDHWTSWSGTSVDAGIASSEQARSGVISYLVDGNGINNGILDLGNQIFGQIWLYFWAYIPSNKSGYFNVQESVPVIPSLCGEFYFNRDGMNPGGGEFDGFYPSTFTFPHDQWFSIAMEWDLYGNVLMFWWVAVNGVTVVPTGTPFVDSNGDLPSALGGLNFFSAHESNEFYMDDVWYNDGIVTGIEDLDSKGFTAYPNPVKNILNLSAKETITTVAIYNVLGQEVLVENIDALDATIDTSSLSNGVYYLKVIIGNSEGLVKILK